MTQEEKKQHADLLIDTSNGYKTLVRKSLEFTTD